MFVRWFVEKTGVDLIEMRSEYLRFSVLPYLGGWLYEKQGNVVPLIKQI